MIVELELQATRRFAQREIRRAHPAVQFLAAGERPEQATLQSVAPLRAPLERRE